MSAEREAGIAALQNGRAAEAIPYLEQAIGSAPNDFQALLALGSAYGQMGRHTDAVRVVMQAVTQQPSNASARYSLALAYEAAGHKEYALTAAQQALQLQPDDTKAHALFARLSGPPAQAQPTQSFPAVGQTPAPYGQGFSPQSPSPYGQPGPGTPSAQPGAGGYTPGQAAPPYGAPGAAPYPPQATGNYQGQGAAAYGGSPQATYYTPPPRPGAMLTPDKFDMKQALSDWVRVLREPHAFFQEQAEREGYNAPISFLLAFGIAAGACSILSNLIRLALEPDSAGTIFFQLFLGATSGVTGALIGAFIWAGFLHLVGRLFGNRQLYQKTFRVAAYSQAPMLFFILLSSLALPFILPNSALKPSGNRPSSFGASPFGQVTPVQFTEPRDRSGLPDTGAGGTTTTRRSTTRENPFDSPAFQQIMRSFTILGFLSIAGYIWTWCLQAIGIRYAQNLSPGSAAGTVFLALLLPFLLFVLLGVALVMLIAGAVAASRGSSGFIDPLSLLPSCLGVWRGL